MIYTKEEVLNLDKKTEKEQLFWLKKNGILQPKHCPSCNKPKLCCFCGDDFDAWESLADCAFRLKPEITKHSIFVLYQEMLFPEKDCKLLEIEESYQAVLIWFLFASQPIHWIQAALLARLEAKEND